MDTDFYFIRILDCHRFYIFYQVTDRHARPNNNILIYIYIYNPKLHVTHLSLTLTLRPQSLSPSLFVLEIPTLRINIIFLILGFW